MIHTEAEARLRFNPAALAQSRPREIDLWNRGINRIPTTTKNFITGPSTSPQFVIVPSDPRIVWDVFVVDVFDSNAVDANGDFVNLYYLEYLGVIGANNQALSGLTTLGAVPVPVDQGSFAGVAGLVQTHRVFPNRDSVTNRTSFPLDNLSIPFETRLKSVSALAIGVGYSASATVGSRSVSIQSAVRERRFE